MSTQTFYEQPNLVPCLTMKKTSILAQCNIYANFVYAVLLVPYLSVDLNGQQR